MESSTIKNQRGYTRVLSLSSFRSLWFGQICSQLAVNSLIFILALCIYQTTGSNTAVSGIFLAYGIPAVLFGLVAGTVVDYVDKRRMLIYCDVLRGLLVLPLIFFSGNIALVYIVVFIHSLISQFYVPSEAPLIPILTPKDQLVTANSLFSFTFYSSLAIGSVMAGPFLRWLGPVWIFVAVSCLFLIAALLETRIPSQSKGVYGFMIIFKKSWFHLISRIVQELLVGLRYMSESKALLDGLLLLTGTQIIMAMLGTLGPGFADRMLGVDVRDASLFIVGPAVFGILVGVLWVGNFGYRFRKQKLINTGVLGAGSALICISLIVWLSQFSQFSFLFTHTKLVFVVFLFFLLGVANSLLDVPANSILQEKAEGDMRGRVYGMLTAAVGGVGILPVVIGGVLADAVGVGKVVFLLGAVVLVYGIFRMRYNK